MSEIIFSSNFSQVQQIIIPAVSVEQLSQVFPAFDWAIADFEAKKGEVFVLFHQGKKYYFLGLGDTKKLSEWIALFKGFGLGQKGKFSENIGLSVSHLSQTEGFLNLLDAFVNGLVVSTYQIGLYKTEEKKVFDFQRIELDIAQSEEIEKACQRGLHTGKVQQRVMDLINAPANFMQPKDLANWTRESGKEHGYSVKILDSQSLEDLGMKAILAVNQGSKTSAYCIVAEYKPENAPENLPKIGLVGKGVTYDTGGLNIKINNMHFMKCDMGGATIVLGAIELIARLKLPIHLVVVVPTTENDVDATAVKPGDVIGSYSGKTIEVIDTDAEGRLILADGLAYLNAEYQPDVMIDVATLTGNSVMALGDQAGALFTHDDSLSQLFFQTSETTGERVWRMPLWEEYAREMDSDIADIKNYHGKPMAGAITAAKFLEFFTNKHPRWAHLDIAAMVFGGSPFGKDKNATGYGPRMMVDVLENI